MAAKTWTGLTGNDSAAWDTGTNWTDGVLPASGDSVFINQALSGPYAVWLYSNEGTFAALTVDASNAALVLSYGGFTLAVAGLTTFNAGAIVVNGAATLQTGSYSQTGVIWCFD